MAKARQQYFADEASIAKESREFAITPELLEKINSIEHGAQVNVIETVKVNGEALEPDDEKAVDVSVPLVEDTLYSTDTTAALSAKQGKVLYEYIQNISSRGRYLSNWNCVTGLAMTNPVDNPYDYMAGDYYVISVVATQGGTNYRPNGSQYITGLASTTVETEIVKPGDYYTYDGTNWLLLINTAREIAVDSELSASSTNPVENRVVTGALNTKQNVITDLSTIRSGAAAGATALQPGDSLSQLTGDSDDITEGSTHLFMTTSERTKLSNQSGVNTGDETQATIMSKLGAASSSTNGYLTVGDWNTFNGKQDAISDLSTIRDNATAGASAASTIATYGDIVTHDANEFASASSGALADTAVQPGDNVSVLTNDAGYVTDAYHDSTKQDKLVAGSNIQIASDGVTISATDTTYTDSDFDISLLSDSQGKRAEWDAKQDALVAGNNIQIAADGKTISATDTTYTAGPGISISNNNVISNTQTSAEWGNIQGTLSNQTDLQNALDKKQDKLTAGDNITIEEICEWDTQGPAPDGFHVPLKDEWVALCGILTTTFGLAQNSTTMGTYLKMPMAGTRSSYFSDVEYVGMYGCYWSSTARNSGDYAYLLDFDSSHINPQEDAGTGEGYSVRCFKDIPVIPTSSWTALYQGSGSAGIFWNSTDGLISVSGDGTTWYTIMDKNLGATTVYNQGDTLTDANCGYFYQWGNNYGFPHSGTVTTSGEVFDVSTYGPGNYYSSDEFITRISRALIPNDNLWGGVSQGQSCGVTISSTDTKYTAGTGISIDANNVISNTQTSAEWGNITGTLSDQTDLQTALDAKQDDMVILSYGNSTWNDFITAYQKNGVVYCRASSNSNPDTGSQTRLAFMAYVNNATTPTEVEFQYYRSRSDHNSTANQLDEVYVYKLTSNGTWSVTQRNTAAKATAGTGINLAFGSGNMTISNTGVTSVNSQTGDVTLTIPTVPTNVSDFVNDAGYITANDLPTVDTSMSDSSTNAVQNNVIKNYVDTQVQEATSGAVSDTAYGNSWDGITGIAPSKNAVYDKISAMDTTIAGKQNTISDLSTIRSGASKGATALQSGDNISELTNDAGFITKAVSDLTNYYTKSEVYTKAEVADYVANFSGFDVVATLPTTDIKTTIIYLLGPVGSGADKYEEYIYSNNTWIKIGDTTVDLSPYFNKNSDTSDAITQGSTNLFLTSAERTKLSNTSGTNTGDETKTTIQTKLGAATSSNDGYLTSADWSTFNNKLGTSAISDTAYGSGWNADTAHAPSKNAVYDKISAMDTTISGKANASDVNTRTFYVSSTSDTAGMQRVINYLDTGNNPIVDYGDSKYTLYAIRQEDTNKVFYFYALSNDTGSGTKDNLQQKILMITQSSGGTYSMTTSTLTLKDIFLSKTNTTSYTPTANYHPATKKYVDDTSAGKVSDTAYASSWNGVTTVAPSKNAVYDKISAMDTTIAGKADSSSLATVATTGAYSDLTGTPTIPTVNNGTLTITQNGTSKGTFTANQSGASTIALTDTTYESKAAASGGTDVSLVTTGEKYTWNNKQNALTSQTAYSAKGTASKVPQITTNSLGQVTGITEVNISYPSQVNDTAYASSWNGVTTVAPSKNAVYDKISAIDTTISNKANSSDVLTKTNTTSFTPTGDYQPATKKYVDDAVAGTSSSSTITITLSSTGWNSSNQQTLNATGVTASNTVIISPAPSNIGEYTGAGIYCSAQASGTLTFTCASLPDDNISVNVVILG